MTQSRSDEIAPPELRSGGSLWFRTEDSPMLDVDRAATRFPDLRVDAVDSVDSVDLTELPDMTDRPGLPELPERRSSNGAPPFPMVHPRPSAIPVLRTGPIAVGDRPTAGAHRWLPRFLAALLVLDAVAMVIGGLFGRMMNEETDAVTGVPYVLVMVLVVPTWLLMLAASRAYERTCLGLGSEEYRRVGNAAVRFAALLTVVVFLFKMPVPRGLVVLALPTA